MLFKYKVEKWLRNQQPHPGTFSILHLHLSAEDRVKEDDTLTTNMQRLQFAPALLGSHPVYSYLIRSSEREMKKPLVSWNLCVYDNGITDAGHWGNLEFFRHQDPAITHTHSTIPRYQGPLPVGSLDPSQQNLGHPCIRECRRGGFW